jgi:hypothetical protein
MAFLQLQQQNVAAASAFAEVSAAIPPRVNEVTVQLRAADTLYWYMAPSGSVSPGSAANLPALYNTIAPGASRTIRGQLGGQTIYFQVATAQAGQVIEVDYYGDN